MPKFLDLISFVDTDKKEKKLTLRTENIPNTIPVRDDDGCFQCGDPITEEDAVNFRTLNNQIEGIKEINEEAAGWDQDIDDIISGKTHVFHAKNSDLIGGSTLQLSHNMVPVIDSGSKDIRIVSMKNYDGSEYVSANGKVSILLENMDRSFGNLTVGVSFNIKFPYNSGTYSVNINKFGMFSGMLNQMTSDPIITYNYDLYDSICDVLSFQIRLSEGDFYGDYQITIENVQMFGMFGSNDDGDGLESTDGQNPYIININEFEINSLILYYF